MVDIFFSMGDSNTLEIDTFYSLQDDLVQGWYVDLEEGEVDVFTYGVIGKPEEDALRLPEEFFPGFKYRFDSFDEPELIFPFHPFAFFCNPSDYGDDDSLPED